VNLIYKLSSWLMMSLFVLSLTNCIKNEDSVCGQTFTEKEINDIVSEANAYGIVLTRGCKITITGSLDDTMPNPPILNSDFIRFNTGDSKKIKVLLTWDNPTFDLDLYIVDEFNKSLGKAAGLNDFESIEWTTDKYYYPRYVRSEVFSALCVGCLTNYTLIIEGL